MFSWRQWHRQKLHASVFIAFLSSGIIAGVAISPLLGLWFAGFSWVVLVIVLAGACVIWRRAWLVIIAVGAGLLLGLWRGDGQLLKIDGYKPYVNRNIHLTGTVIEDVGEGKHGDTQVELGNIRINDRHMPEKVWVSLHTKTILKRSDTMTLEGKLQPGFGSFAASMNYGKLISHKEGDDAARDVRDWFTKVIRKVIAEPEASLGLGFVVGQRSSLPVELDQQLQIVGLTHIVVASGYNLTVLVRLARRLFSRVSKYLTAASSFAMIGGFILVTGLSPSMSRAGLVAGLSLAAWYYGRALSPFVLLPLVSAISLLANPSYIWGDVGWFLSFAAFGGVMIIAPLVQDYFFDARKPGFIRQVLGETVAALLVTAPIIMLVFGQYSVYALLANLLVVPVIPYVMLAVFSAGLASVVLPLAGPLASLPAAGLLHYVTGVVQWIANLPDAQSEVTLSGFGLGLYYALVALACWYMWAKTKHNFRNDNLIE
jgi:competence protein ComEC